MVIGLCVFVGLFWAQQSNVDSDFLAASAGGDAAKLTKLLAQGVDVNVRNDSGQTPVLLAAAAGHLEAVKLLLKRGADANATDKSGATALMLATMEGHASVLDVGSPGTELEFAL